MKRIITLSATAGALALAVGTATAADDPLRAGADHGDRDRAATMDRDPAATLGADRTARTDTGDTLSHLRMTDASADTPLQVPVGQLEGANVVAQDGDKVGNVEAVLRGDNGDADSILVELDSGLFEEGRLIIISFDEVEARSTDGLLGIGDRIELVANQSQDWFERQPNVRDRVPADRGLTQPLQ